MIVIGLTSFSVIVHSLQ